VVEGARGNGASDDVPAHDADPVRSQERRALNEIEAALADVEAALERMD